MSTTKQDTWRLRELVDEPLYCAATDPTNANDTCYYDSDGELDSSTRLTKRLRYEAAGRRFLSGQRPRLLSASLRGPFDAKYGWPNPWLRKPSHDRPQKCTEPPVRSRIASYSEREGQKMPCDDSTAAIATKYSSVAVTTPSSITERDAPYTTPNVHIHHKKRLEIQVWADNVEMGLAENDQDFWNPLAKDIAQDEVPGRNTETIPAQNGWLKKTPLKRKRSRPHPQDPTNVISNPSQLLRSTSASAALPSSAPATTFMRRQEVSTLLKSRSFELTTPSSLADPPFIALDRNFGADSQSASEATSTSSVSPHDHLSNAEDDIGSAKTMQETTAHDCKDLDDDQPHTNLQSEQIRQIETQLSGPIDETLLSCASHVAAKGKPEGDSHGLARILTQTETPESSHHPDEMLTILSNEAMEPDHLAASQALLDVIANSNEEAQLSNPVVSSVLKQEPHTEDFIGDDAAQLDRSPIIRHISSQPEKASDHNPFLQSIQLGNDPLPTQLGGTDDDTQRMMTDSRAEGSFKIKTETKERTPDVNFASLQTIAIAASQLSESRLGSEDQSTSQADVEGISTIDFSNDDAPFARADHAEIEESFSMAVATNDEEEADERALVFTEPSQINTEALALTPDSEENSRMVHTGEEEEEEKEEAKNVTPEDSFVRPSQQSPWAPCDQGLLEANNVDVLRAPSTEHANEDAQHSLLVPESPATPPRSSTTTANLGLKSFSRFNTPSPQRRSAQRIAKRYSTGHLRGILSSKSPRQKSRGARRCVSFAPLPNDQGEETDVLHNVRAASPPPVATPAFGDDDISDQFRNHFDSMRRKKATTRNASPGRPHPSFSCEALAPAEQETSASGVVTPSVVIESGTCSEENVGHTDEPVATNELQSPWREDTQSDMVDDVAAVMGNLDEFLDAWSVEHEMQKVSQPADQENRSREQSKTRVSGTRFGLQELSVWN